MRGKRLAEARRWFQQAFYDLEAARWNLKGGFNNTVCFLAQQSGEKALKSLLYYLGSRRRALLTHSLVEMIQEADRKAEGFGELMEEGRNLDLHYIPSRYPNGLPAGYPQQFYSKRVAQDALKAAQKILDRVRSYYETHKEDEILKP